jgi:hypothetical protein
MGKSSEWFIRIKEQEVMNSVDEHVMYYTLNYEQDCDNSPIV